MEREHEAIRNNVYISDSDDIDNDSDTREESYSAKRARWYQEDQERNDCLVTIWKMDEELENLLTHGSDHNSDSNDSVESNTSTGEELVRFLANGSKNTPASPDSEYSPASPEYNADSSDTTPNSPASAWCYTCDDELDYCSCQCPWSPSINYKPCEVCEREQCECLRLPVKQAEIDYITLD